MLKYSRYKGLVYRGHDPRWAFAPDSGDGAKFKGGRFNPKGMSALYTSMTFQGAWLESQQSLINKPQPLTMYSYNVDCADLIDLTIEDNLKSLNLTIDDLRGNWIIPNFKGKLPTTQQLAKNLVAKKSSGIIVHSFVNSAYPKFKNVIFWNWSTAKPHQVLIIDY